MKYEEAKEIIENMCTTWSRDVDEALIIAIDALERQIPKKPVMWGDGYADGELVIEEYECPNCGAIYEIDGETYQYCPNCSQAIDWSEEE